jgi:hypothetical protein
MRRAGRTQTLAGAAAPWLDARPARALIIAALAGTLVPASAGASLPEVSGGERPGPAALYAPPPAQVPQLENAGPWRAEPILVSGARAYRDGEFLYQDFLYDDHGADGDRDSEDPYTFDEYLIAPRAGTYTYPTDPVYADNAADLVELRVRPLAGATALRVTVNTLKDPERTAFTVALGGSESPRPWPQGAGVSSPAQLFLTVHGDEAELRDASTDTPLAPAPTVTVDQRRRQFDVRIPHTAWNPGTASVRMAAGLGVWDPEADRYLEPQDSRGESQPGGAASSGAALTNLAFRFDEPKPQIANPASLTLFDAGVFAALDGSWWRERAQADALEEGDVSDFSVQVDFAKLASQTDDDSGVPKQGPIDRILASRHVFGQGVDHDRACFRVFGEGSLPESCAGRYVGQLQPYALYVPSRPPPARGWGMTLLLHSLAANHNQYLDSNNQSQLGERGAGSLVATPLGRGPDGFYFDIAEADAFEVWADVARHYRLDPGWAAVSGYSMGGYGTFRFLTRWPDLFGRGMTTVGPADAAGYEKLAVLDQFPSLRHTPLMTWAAAADELVPITETEAITARLRDLRLRFASDLFPSADHLTLATNDEYGPAADFLGEHRAVRDPARVTYVVDPASDSGRAGAVADHAYWLSALRPRGSKGTIDARSAALGRGDPPAGELEQGAGTLNGGAHGPMPFTRRARDWGAAPETEAANALRLDLGSIAAATVSGERARLRGDRPLRVTIASDGPGELGLDLSFPAGTTAERIEGPAVPASGSARAAAVAPEVEVSRERATFRLAAGTRTYLLSVPAAGDDAGGGRTPGSDDASDEPAPLTGDGGQVAAGAAGGELPFTGLPLALVGLLGLLALAMGHRLRRRAR